MSKISPDVRSLPRQFRLRSQLYHSTVSNTDLRVLGKYLDIMNSGLERMVEEVTKNNHTSVGQLQIVLCHIS